MLVNIGIVFIGDRIQGFLGRGRYHTVGRVQCHSDPAFGEIFPRPLRSIMRKAFALSAGPLTVFSRVFAVFIFDGRPRLLFLPACLKREPYLPGKRTKGRDTVSRQDSQISAEEKMISHILEFKIPGLPKY